VVTAAAVARLDRNTPVTIMEAKPDQSGLPVKWARVRTQTGVEGWMREDVLRFNSAAAQFGLMVADRYPASMVERWWVRGFEGPAASQHWGWDWGAKVGEPVLTGPNGGQVLKSQACTKCTAQKPSFKDYGIPLSDSTNLNDPAWNFGYGHYVIVRYLNNQLPASTQQALAGMGLGGGHIFTMYAHLNSRAVSDGQALAAGQPVGTCGDTGNSQAAHLHLEIRASMNANDINWAGMKKNLLDPTILFQR
jgi:murein DD-endopeptidase MepM/ murein hydrolase activator NlpD